MDAQGSEPKWRVANYQIPVPIGDCSAHILINKQEGKVIKAFLMDGGTNAGGYHAWVQILKGLRHIDLELGADWKFDNWVVTRWDDDHYRGVRDLLSSNLKMSRCVQNGAGTPTGRTASTTFAKQYFSNKAWLLCGALDRTMFSNGKRHYINFLEPFMNDQKIGLNSSLGSSPDSVYKNNLAKTYEVIQNADLRCIASRQLVGLDLFTRTRQFTFKGEICTTQSTEDKSMGVCVNPHTDQPIVCVIGANAYGIGIEERYPKEPSRNETSILALIYWPGNAGGGRISYYTGGDGHPELAKHIVKDWLKAGDKYKPNGEVGLMKLDHHGSTKENLGHKDDYKAKGSGSDIARPKSDVITDVLVKMLKPKGLLVTPGNRHGHPTWDVLLEIHDYFRERKEYYGLFTTRSFYWLNSQQPTGIKSLNSNHNNILYMQQLYEGIYNAYHEIGADSVDDPDVVLHDLIVLDQPHRVAAQAEFKRHKKIYGELLSQRGRSGITQDGNTNWGAVHEVILEECQGILRLGQEAMNKALSDESQGLTKDLFWAWYSWAWNVYEAQLEGANQYADICWQPIISEANPHYLIRFIFGDSGKDTSIDVFNDDGGSQFVRQADESVACVKTDLVVEDEDKWASLVYTPLGIATIFDPKDAAHIGFMTDLKLVNQAVFNPGKLSDPVKSKGPSTKKPLTPAKLMAKHEKTQLEKRLKVEGLLENYRKQQSLSESEMLMDAADEEWFLEARAPRTKGQTGEPVLSSYYEREQFKLRSMKMLKRLGEKELKVILNKHKEVRYFAWRYLRQTRGAVEDLKGPNPYWGRPQNQAQLDTLIRNVYFLLLSWEFDHGAEKVLKKKKESELDAERRDYFEFLAETYCSEKNLDDFLELASVVQVGSNDLADFHFN